MTKLVVVTADTTAVALQSLSVTVEGLREGDEWEVIGITEPTVCHAQLPTGATEVTAFCVVDLE